MKHIANALAGIPAANVHSRRFALRCLVGGAITTGGLVHLVAQIGTALGS